MREAGIEPGSIALLVVLLIPALTCGRDPFHPARLLGGLLALGFVIGPVVHALTGFYALPGGPTRQRANLDDATWILVPAAALAMVAMRVVLGETWRKEVRPVASRPITTKAMYIGALITVLGIGALLAYLALLGRSGLLLQKVGETYTQQTGESRKAYLNLLAPIALGGLFLFAAAGLERGRRLLTLAASACAVAAGVLLALPGSRANLLYGVVPLVVIFACYRGFPRLRWLAPIFVLTVAALLYGTSLRNPEARSMLVEDPIGTLTENRPNQRDIEALLLVDIAHTESLLGAIDAYPTAGSFMGGESFALGATGPFGWKFSRIIGLDPDPIAGVTLTANAYGEDPATFGSGLTATLPGELYANVGVVGVIVGLTAFGAILGWIRNRALRSPARGKVVLYAIAITTLLAVFADYSGQLYRGGAVFVGALIALIIADRKDFRLKHAFFIGVVIALSAAVILTVRRWTGPPPAEVLASMLPAYAAAGTVAIVGAIHLIRRRSLSGGERLFDLGADKRPRTDEPASSTTHSGSVGTAGRRT